MSKITVSKLLLEDDLAHCKNCVNKLFLYQFTLRELNLFHQADMSHSVKILTSMKDNRQHIVHFGDRLLQRGSARCLANYHNKLRQEPWSPVPLSGIRRCCSEFTNRVLLTYKGSRGHPHSQVSLVTEKHVGCHRNGGSIFGWNKILKNVQTLCGTV